MIMRTTLDRGVSSSSEIEILKFHPATLLALNVEPLAKPAFQVDEVEFRESRRYSYGDSKRLGWLL